MKINITKKEYRTLLEMLYISDWILHSFTSCIEEENESHKALRDKILSFYKEMQAEDLIKEDSDGIYETDAFDKYMHKNHIDEYNQNVFWELLIDQLSYRDLAKEIGIKAINELDLFERMEKLEKFRENYANEFDQHQLEHVTISYTAK